MFKTIAEKMTGNKITAYMINIDEIKVNPFQPRKKFNNSDLDELCESIKQFGVLQPLLVRKINNEYELIAGERRLRASVKAGLTTVPCILTEMDDEKSAAISLIENLQRKDLDYFEEAEGIKRLIDVFGYTQEETAKILGKSQPSIANKLRLLRINNGLRKLITENGLTERHARALLVLDDDSKRKLAIDRIISLQLNVEQSEKLIEKIKENKPIGKAKPLKLVFKDTRIFTNTINNALKVMKDSGINAISKKRENDEYIIYMLKIPKRKVQLKMKQNKE